MISFFRSRKKINIDHLKTNIINKPLVPIFIIGVLRSGTTLLRIILDSHSKIVAPSETPWILGGYGDNSVRQLSQFLVDDKWGPVQNLPDVDENIILHATRCFISEIFTPIIRNKNKDILVLKTPQDIKYLEFLLSLYPISKYIHIFRDGRDSACSLVENKSQVFGAIDDYGELNHLNAFKRWYDWELKIRKLLDEKDKIKIRIKYEDLVTKPESTLKVVCDFIGVDFEPEILNYSKFNHTLPKWEAGTYDLEHKKSIDDSSIGRWKEHFKDEETVYIQKHYGKFLKSLGYT
ncbi:sulfotransferase family protein [Geobacter argillaceus]|uniref:Sulfotransferase family protein n=1 Tax=Geobacter argillaceus TaxID=345631 RepID=A0A562WRV5_9BACT|nr:sulfotransferase [Geobacter argillaceus]TWJ33047.1 sulfotransferase family protein [Geobacter argillaceus]